MNRFPAVPRNVVRWALLAPAFAAAVVLSSTGGGPVDQTAVTIETLNGEEVVHNAVVPARVARRSGDGGMLLFLRGSAVTEGNGTRIRDDEAVGEWLEARSVREFSLAIVDDADPLIRRFNETGRVVGGLGTVTVPTSGFLGELVNTGWLASSDDGAVYFASAVRPEVVRFDRSGNVVWRSTRPVAVDVSEPGLTAEGGRLSPRFREVQHGIAVGPDQLLYVLTATPDPDSVRLDILTESGRFMHTAMVSLDDAVRVDRRGHIRTGPAGAADNAVNERPVFATFDLPRLGATGRVDLDDYKGSVVLVNMWASWCAPCRREMPQLDQLSVELEADGLVVIGLNEDTDPSAASQFLDRIGGVHYLLAEGRGELRSKYRYIGLPYTVVLDRHGRVATTIYGFGDSIEEIRTVVRAELEWIAAERHYPTP